MGRRPSGVLSRPVAAAISAASGISRCAPFTLSVLCLPDAPTQHRQRRASGVLLVKVPLEKVMLCCHVRTL